MASRRSRVRTPSAPPFEEIKDVTSEYRTIYPELRKARGKGNGVTPIKLGLMKELKRQGWKLEEPLDIAILKRSGKLDAVLHTDYGPVALEWETGNISSFVKDLPPEK
jgi:hypothetical protein